VVRVEKFLQIRKGLDAPERAGAVRIDSEHGSVEECGQQHVINSVLDQMYPVWASCGVYFARFLGSVIDDRDACWGPRGYRCQVNFGRVMGAEGGEGAWKRGRTKFFNREYLRCASAACAHGLRSDACVRLPHARDKKFALSVKVSELVAQSENLGVKR
jgi:hypothetical protein